MKVTETSLPGVLLVETRIFADPRGHFRESWHARRYADAGIPAAWVQDNVSFSRAGVVRGLHFQEPRAQGKLVSVLHGAIWDVAVDLRVDSPAFGRWIGIELTAEGGEQLYIPPGFAHGFAVTSPDALVSYKCTELHHPADERTLLWNDPELAIPWPVREPLLSDKDLCGRTLEQLRPELAAPAGA